MPNVKDGKVSLNLKITEEQYNKWVEAAAKQKILNMSQFIRDAVDEFIKGLK